MAVARVCLILLALVGHGALWVGINNRWHGTGLPRKLVKGVSLIIYLVLLGLPLLVGWRLAADVASGESTDGGLAHLNWATAYLAICAAFGAVHIPRWAWWRWRSKQPLAAVTKRGDRIIDLCQQIGAAPTTSPRTRLFCRIPFNQLWQLHVSEYEVVLPGLPASLDGLSLCHLSDLHFSPRIERSYFDEVVALVNTMGVDLVALTGDVCDKAPFIDWIPATLGQIDARLAKLFILGNHDLRTKDVARLRATMQSSGFVDVSGRVKTLPDLPIAVAGNERPWFPAPSQIDALPAGTFKLLLSHTPDQLAWARKHGFDLMLAGHTHGGQIQFPWIGPVVCPSLHGIKYACGFYASAPTLLHVSRGTASLFPYRMNCRPELTRLVLRATS